jgi:hypothetical protein
LKELLDKAWTEFVKNKFGKYDDNASVNWKAFADKMADAKPEDDPKFQTNFKIAVSFP